MTTSTVELAYEKAVAARKEIEARIAQCTKDLEDLDQGEREAERLFREAVAEGKRLTAKTSGERIQQRREATEKELEVLEELLQEARAKEGIAHLDWIEGRRRSLQVQAMDLSTTMFQHFEAAIEVLDALKKLHAEDDGLKNIVARSKRPIPPSVHFLAGLDFLVGSHDRHAPTLFAEYLGTIGDIRRKVEVRQETEAARLEAAQRNSNPQE